MSSPKNFPIIKSETEWRSKLNDEEYRILRQKGTEHPFTGKYNDHFEKGVYKCKGCNTPIYRSENKFDSSCGWPSYDQALPGALLFVKDLSLIHI